MSLGRAARLAAQALARGPQARSAGDALFQQQRRGMASGAGRPSPWRPRPRSPGGQPDRGAGPAGSHHGEGVTYAGLTLHKPSRWHVLGAEAFGGLMWFWILYRGYHDWEVFAARHRCMHACMHARLGRPVRA